MNNKKQIQSSLALVLAALIWGVAFVAQSESADFVGTFTFNATRFFIGGLVLLPFILVKEIMENKRLLQKPPFINKTILIGGLLCGFIICVSSCFQQFGIALGTSAGKAGFITALYIIIVPLIGIFFKKKTNLLIWICVLIAIVGMYLLCITKSFSIKFCDIMVIICAIGFSFHILVIDYFSSKVSSIKLSCIQFFTAAIICTFLAFIFEKPDFSDILKAYIPILYAGIMSCGIAYTLQIVGQKNTNPTFASLLLSLESVFAVIAGFLILGERLTYREIFGCILVFTAIILVQIPYKQKKLSKYSKIA